MMRIVIAGSVLGVLAAAGCTAGGDNQFHVTGSGSGAASTGPTTAAGGRGGGVTFNDAGTASGGATGADTVVTPSCTSNCKDFPSTPILDGAVPANPGSLFGAPGTFTPGLCIVEPQLSSG